MKIDIGFMFFFFKYLGNWFLFGFLIMSDGVWFSVKWFCDFMLGMVDFLLIFVIFLLNILDMSEIDKFDNKEWKIVFWGFLFLCYGVILGFSLFYGLRNF